LLADPVVDESLIQAEKNHAVPWSKIEIKGEIVATKKHLVKVSLFSITIFSKASFHYIL